MGQKFDTKNRQTVRNLRIREDKAKYLINLDPNSAHYDPKTRSMRENPLSHLDASETPYVGDNFHRHTGDSTEMAKNMVFAWDAQDRGNDSIHLQANPTMGEILYRRFLDKKDSVTAGIQDKILAKYGGETHINSAPPRELLLAQSEEYVEYNPLGKVIAGQEKAKVKSRYQEDILFGNHTQVWGSFWRNRKWGYSCCEMTSRHAYCTGEEGKEANRLGTPIREEVEDISLKKKTLMESHIQELISTSKSKKKTKMDSDSGSCEPKPPNSGKAPVSRSRPSDTGGKRLGEGLLELDRGKLALALDSERKGKRMVQEKIFDFQKGRKSFQEAMDEADAIREGTSVTEEGLEAWRMELSKRDDPMAN